MGSFEELYRQHVRAVFRFAMSVVGDKATAEDLTSEAFLALHRNLDAIDQARVEKPDIILLDVMMPLIDGFEVCKRLKADPATAQIPVIMLSAASHAESVQKGINAGAVDYLVKPFEPEQLENLLVKVIKSGQPA
jgi:DNA-binding response OmpR family regulator